MVFLTVRITDSSPSGWLWIIFLLCFITAPLWLALISSGITRCRATRVSDRHAVHEAAHGGRAAGARAERS